MSPEDYYFLDTIKWIGVFRLLEDIFYLRYKTITSQCHLKHKLRIFWKISGKNYILFSRYLSLQLALGNQMFPVWVRLLPMCEANSLQQSPDQCLSVCEASGSGSEALKKSPTLSPAVLWFVNGFERKPK